MPLLQICATPPSTRSGANYVPAWKSVEALLGRQLEHQNIVRTFKHCTVLVQVTLPPPPPQHTHPPARPPRGQSRMKDATQLI